MPDQGERITAVEVELRGLRDDMSELREEQFRVRRRVHDLEGFASAYLSIQKENRRSEDRQYRRLANAVGIGGLAMSAGMLILAAVTLYAHLG